MPKAEHRRTFGYKNFVEIAIRAKVQFVEWLIELVAQIPGPLFLPEKVLKSAWAFLARPVYEKKTDEGTCLVRWNEGMLLLH